MTPLSYITRGNSSPRGKSRVYFCCHPDDQSAFLKPLADQILALQNCAVWYDPEPGAPLSPDRREELAQMQLFVVPVTSRFLTDPSPALTEEFSLALEQHIPVLPLLQEPGLESLFNEKCGDLQCLDPNQTDPTALPYAEKLKKFLNGVLVGDELAAQVRAAFDAYIFLSYRKKDRKEAQALMRLIHENEFCRDIAIWYDEFLTPGENFNAAITQALEKSGLFVLAVTPHLLETGNYVMTQEFPAARGSGKPILPVEMDPTDRAGLEAAYPGIPACAGAATLPAGLKDALRGLALREHTDPKHDYFIGLAYLAGIDVEVDKARGLSLIRAAAQKGLPEAIEKLAAVYRTGESVGRNYRQSAEWLRKLANVRQTEWKTQQDKNSFHMYISSLWDLGDLYNEMGNLVAARTVWEKESLPLIVHGKEKGILSARWYRVVCCSKLGDLCCKEGNLTASQRWLEEGMNLALAEKTNSPEARRVLSVSFGKLGNLCLLKGDLSAARRWFEKCLELTRILADETHTVEARRNLSVSCSKLGEVCQAAGDLLAARRWFEESLELRRALAGESGTVEARRDLSISCNNLGDLCRAEGDLPAARRWFEESLKLRHALAGETGTAQDRRSLADSCSRLGEECQAEGDLYAAQHWFEESLSLLRARSNENETSQSQDAQLLCCIRLSDLCLSQGKFTEAQSWLRQGLKIRSPVSNTSETTQSQQILAALYDRWGNLFQSKNNVSEARNWFEESLKLRRDLASKLNTCQSQNDLAVSLYKLGTLPDGNKDLLLEAIDIWTRLSREYPDRPEFAQYRIHTCVEYTMRSPLGKFLKWLQRKFSKDTKDSR